MTDNPGADPGPAPVPTRSRRRFREGRVSLGSALGRSFSIWGTNLVPFALLALMIYWPLGLAKYLCYSMLGADEASDGLLILAGGLGFLEATFMNFLLIGTLTVLVVRRLQNRPVELVDGLKGGLRSIPKVVGVSLVVALSVGLPVGVSYLLTFFVHGIFGLLILFTFILAAVLWVKWFVAVPVAIIERPGVGACLARSTFLVRGRSWSIFGMALLMGVIMIVMQVPLYVVAYILTDTTTLGNLAENVWIPGFAFIVLTPLSATFNAVVYHTLREAREGPTTDKLAEVFD